MALSTRFVIPTFLLVAFACSSDPKPPTYAVNDGGDRGQGGDSTSGDPGTAGDRAGGEPTIGDLDTGDGILGDPSAGDSAIDCASLSPAALSLFTDLGIGGASNSPCHGTMSTPAGPGDCAGSYYGMILIKAWERLQPCGASPPELWVETYQSVAQLPETLTLSLCVDAFFHYLDDGPDTETFRDRVNGYIDTLTTTAPNVFFVGANVPEAMMFSITGDKSTYNAIIAEELATRGFSMVDVDSFFGSLLSGLVTYDGDVLTTGDVMSDQIHVNTFGQQIVSDLFIEELNRKFPTLGLTTHGTIAILE